MKITIIFILFFSSLTYASPKKYDELVLVLKKFPEKEDDLIKIRAKHGLKVKERLKNLPVQVLKLNKKTSAKNIEKICKNFSELKNVKHCEANKVLKLDPSNDCVDCTVEADALGPVERTMANLVRIRDLLQEDSCDLLEIDSIKDRLPKSVANYKKRSPLWAQEYIGADLAKKAILESKEAQKVSVAVFDRGFEYKSMNIEGSKFLDKPTYSDTNSINTKYHGTLVSNLINGKGSYSTSAVAELKSIHNISRTADTYTSVDKMFSNKSVPKVLSMSMEWGGDTSQYRKLLEKDVIIVTSAGNKGSDPVIASKIDFNHNVIVGSMDTMGFKSGFSQEDPKLTISAPSDFHIISQGPNKELRKFSGTSAATPVVAGSITNVLSLLPQIEIEDVKKLLEKTAIATSQNLENPHKSGYGMINAYKMVEVAKVIYEKCKKEQFPKRCHQKELDKDENYNFSSSLSKEEVNKVFPGCLDGDNDALPSSPGELCDDKKETLTKMRKQAFLNPTDWKMWEALSCVHKGLGLSTNATFYQQLSLVNRPESERIKLMNSALKKDDYELKRLVLRLAGASKHSKYKSVITQGARDNDPKIRELATNLLKNF